MVDAQTGSWPTPVRGRNVQFDHLGISGGRIQANNRGVVSHLSGLNSPTRSDGFWFPIFLLTQSNKSTRFVRAV